MVVYQINETVSKIGQIAIEGNIIPNEWYIHLKNEKGKIQTNAALILADIVYWYRPIPVYDIQTGVLNTYGKKFKDDLLQLGYKYFHEKFGLTEVQTRSALVFLEEKGLIFREFRNIVLDYHVLNNIMYIGIYPEKISEISGRRSALPISRTNKDHTPRMDQTPLQIVKTPTDVPSTSQSKTKEKDWSSKFTNEQKTFLDYLLNIKPEIGDPIEKNHATWWIKNYGIEKIKIALKVYWERVEKAKQDHAVPMPQHIGKYVRKVLNENIQPHQSLQNPSTCHPYSQKSNQVVTKIETGLHKNETTNTQISMTSMFINEVNDSASLTFQKEKKQEKVQLTRSIKENEYKTSPQTIKTASSHYQKANDSRFKKLNSEQDWKMAFTSEEKKFLAFLLSLIPATGDKIEEKHATWWIKHFGIEKIKIALQVYWQQVEKAKKDPKVPIPESIGAYVRDALNKGTQPCLESHFRNKDFAEQFKRQMKWSELVITEKYCRLDDLGKEWHYSLPEPLFIDSLRSTFENYCELTDRQSYVARN
jgi:hypothetical protein